MLSKAERDRCARGGRSGAERIAPSENSDRIDRRLRAEARLDRISGVKAFPVMEAAAAVRSTPIGTPVPGSRPAHTQAEGSPSRFAGTNARTISAVAATFAADAMSKPTSNGMRRQAGDSTIG